jgi:E3 ubiquitin-protein ligase HECTD2
MSWRTKVDGIGAEFPGSSKTGLDGEQNANEIDQDLLAAKEHTLRALLKITENILKRPSRPMKEAEETRFLFILLSNPSLHQSQHRVNSPLSPYDSRPKRQSDEGQHGSDNLKYPNKTPGRSKGLETLPHSGIFKRTFGILANAPEICHRYFIGWFAYLEEPHLVKIVDLVALFVTHRISHGSRMAHRGSSIDDGGLIPDLSGSASNTSAQLLTAMGLSGPMSKKRGENGEQEPHWADDWQLKAAAKVMSLLFAANNIWHDQPRGMSNRSEPNASKSTAHSAGRGRKSGQLLHTSTFYNTLLDFYDMIADYRIWEAKRDKFAFCQYPLFLSMGTKIKILEYDARRQMEIKAREAYFDQVVRQRVMDGHFHLRIRRECIVDDSLRQISEAVGAGQEELKKGLRVHFTGEEGVDAGGPRKEWFLMLVRDIFDPNHGMFIYDEDSNVCYFNSNSFETSDQYYLVGALLGLAIYNSTILDVALPSFVFRKLLSAAPMANNSALTSPIMAATKVQMVYTLADLAEFRPMLAAGLQQLLNFEGDVESTYCWDFVASQDRFGTVVTVPLKPNGENIPVTNANRHEFVDTYVRYLLDGAVARQFEPFKRGFFTVCAGNALSLFRAEEIEMLVRGSEEMLDVDLLRGVAIHENWKEPDEPHRIIADPAESVPVVMWFWEIFREASSEKQRLLLTFVTGSDRIPALGATSLVLRIVAGGDGWGGGGEEARMRFPIARTCFNMLVLWHYERREQLEEKLWRAIDESEGFTLK